MKHVHGRSRSPKGIDQRAVSRAVFSSWMTHLFRVEADAARDGRRHSRVDDDDLRDALPGDNGAEEHRRLARLADAWRARKLVVLDVSANGTEEAWLDGLALRRWNT